MRFRYLVIFIVAIVCIISGNGYAQKNNVPGSPQTNQVSLPVRSDRVLYTEVIPSVSSGGQAESYDAAFSSKEFISKQGRVVIQLGSNPAIIEEITSPENSSNPSFYAREMPFGIHGIEDNFEANLRYLKDLGVHNVVNAGQAGAVWDMIEPQPGSFNWSHPDLIYQRDIREGLGSLVVVVAVNSWDQSIHRSAMAPRPRLICPRNVEAYRRFLRQLVTRYPAVKYWQINNEVDTRVWEDSMEKYGELLRLSYKTIKEANPKAGVALAGISSPAGYYSFYRPLLDYLQKKYPGEKTFDLVSFHWSEQFKGTYKSLPIGGVHYEMDRFIKDLKAQLAAMGQENTPLWITELSDYDGKPAPDPIDGDFPMSSEARQAASLFKMHVHALTHGVQKIFWTTIIEFHNWGDVFPVSYFDHVGLVHNPLNDGKNTRKLAYFTYKLMVQKLSDCDFSRAETLQLPAGITGYRVPKNNGNVYILWREDLINNDVPMEHEQQ